MKTLGNLFIVSAPSGGGKTTLVKSLVEKIDKLEISISHTTRAPRPQEVIGQDYYFVTEKKFQAMVDNKQFVEFAQVFDNRYGTSLKEINSRLNSGIDIIFDIDWQGAIALSKKYSNAVSIFILPPSLEILERRLNTRGQDNATIISGRMLKAKQEMSHFDIFDYLVINDDFDKALSDLSAIIKAQRMKRERQKIINKDLLSILLSVD